jgi:hypothetical protein
MLKCKLSFSRFLLAIPDNVWFEKNIGIKRCVIFPLAHG